MDDQQLKEKMGSNRDVASVHLPGNASNVGNIESKDLPSYISSQDKSEKLIGQSGQGNTGGIGSNFGDQNLKNATFNQGKNDQDLLGKGSK